MDQLLDCCNTGKIKLLVSPKYATALDRHKSQIYEPQKWQGSKEEQAQKGEDSCNFL